VRLLLPHQIGPVHREFLSEPYPEVQRPKRKSHSRGRRTLRTPKANLTWLLVMSLISSQWESILKACLRVGKTRVASIGLEIKIPSFAFAAFCGHKPSWCALEVAGQNYLSSSKITLRIASACLLTHLREQVAPKKNGLVQPPYSKLLSLKQHRRHHRAPPSRKDIMSLRFLCRRRVGQVHSR